MRIQPRIAALAAAASRLAAPAARRLTAAAGNDWTQWGGPHRNFMSDATRLASTWPAAGPKRLWSRPLGEGHRRSQEEVIVALDAATGKTVSELKYPSTTDGVDFSQGAGPHSTPLIAGTRIFATSSRRELFALDKATGTVAWSHDFIKDMKSGRVVWQDRSFSRAQLLYADGKVILLDEDGRLGLATVGPDGIKVLARANVLENLSWTPPTLAGTTLYVRDRKIIAAFDLR